MVYLSRVDMNVTSAFRCGGFIMPQNRERALKPLGHVLERRRAFLMALFFTLGVWMAGVLIDCFLKPNTLELSGNALSPISILTLCVIIVFVAIRILEINKFFIVIYFFGLITMFFNYMHIVGLDENKNQNDELTEAIVEYIEEKDYGYRLTCKTEGEGTIIYWYTDSSIGDGIDLIGSVIRANLINELELPEPPSNPNTFDYRYYLYGKGIYLSGRITGKGMDESEIQRSENRFYEIKKSILRRREDFLDRIFEDESNESKAFARGILFGDTGEMDEEVYESFQGNNTAHILAASGLHIGIIYLTYKRIKTAVDHLFGKSLVLDIFFKTFFVLFLFIYGTMTLWTPSITRAIALVYLKLLSEIVNRRYDMLSSVSLINLVMLIFRPFLIFAVGFQMSFFSAYAISIIAPRLRGKIPNKFALTVAIQGFLLLYMMRTYNSFSPVSIVANVITVSLASLYVPIGVLGFMRLFPVGRILSGMGELMIWLDGLIYQEGLFSSDVKSPGLGITAFYMLIIIYLSSETRMIFIERKEESRKASLMVHVVIILLATLFSFWGRSPFDKASQVFIDVGQGDAIHLDWGDEDILIDGGGRHNYNVGKKILKPYLLKNGNSDIDLALSTHEHMDHFKGIEELSEVFDVKEVLTWGNSGNRIALDDERYIEVLWPIPGNEDSSDENFYSRVFMVFDNGIRTLITGDITEPGERALMEEYRGTNKLKCDILKIAHHGSRFSSSTEFLERTSPKVAVISVGKNNSYGHPSNEVIEKLNDLGIIVYRTDIDGAIGIIKDDSGYIVCTNKTSKFDRYYMKSDVR